MQAASLFFWLYLLSSSFINEQSSLSMGLCAAMVLVYRGSLLHQSSCAFFFIWFVFRRVLALSAFSLSSPVRPPQLILPSKRMLSSAQASCFGVSHISKER